MDEHTRKGGRLHEGQPGALGALIHEAVRRAIEVAVDEELTAALGAGRYARDVDRGGYRNGRRPRTLTGPTGPLALTLPRATLFMPTKTREWTSALVPRYQRRLREVNEAMVATAGAIAQGGAALEECRFPGRGHAQGRAGSLAHPLAGRAGCLRAVPRCDCAAGPERRAGRQPSRAGGGGRQKQLVTLECCGGESFDAWKGVVDDLVARGLGRPVVCVIDGHPGLRKAVGLVWPEARVQRCAVHKLRNLERKAPKHALAEVRADFHRIGYAENAAAARAAYTAFERKWTPRCPGVVRSLREGGEELLTFFQFPKSQWKTLRTTNVIERLHEEFRRRVKTQGSLPTEDAALVLLFGLVASGQIRLRRLDGWRQIPAILTQHRRPAA